MGESLNLGKRPIKYLMDSFFLQSAPATNVNAAQGVREAFIQASLSVYGLYSRLSLAFFQRVWMEFLGREGGTLKHVFPVTVPS